MNLTNIWRKIVGFVLTDYSSVEQETSTDLFTNNQLLAGDFGYEKLTQELQNDLEAVKQTAEFQALSEPGKVVFCQYLNDMAQHFGTHIGRHNFLASARVQSWRQNFGDYYCNCPRGVLPQIDLFQPIHIVDLQALKCLESLYELFNDSGPQRESFFSNVSSKDIKGMEFLADSVLVTKTKAFDGLDGIHCKLDATHERLFQHIEKAKNAHYTYAYQAQLIKDNLVIIHYGIGIFLLDALIDVIRQRFQGHFLWNILVFFINVTAVLLFLPPRVLLFCWLFRQHRHSVAIVSNAVETLKYGNFSKHYQCALKCYLGFHCVDIQSICRELPYELTRKMSRKEIKSIREKQIILSDILKDTIKEMSNTCSMITFRIELGGIFVTLMSSEDETYTKNLTKNLDLMRDSISAVRNRAKELCACNLSQSSVWSEAYRNELKRLELFCVVIAAKLDIFVLGCQPEMMRVGNNLETAFLADLRRLGIFYACFTVLIYVKFHAFMSSLFPDTDLTSVLMEWNPFSRFFSRLGLGLFL
ncbi:hypothetical protein PUMCH_001715 [Australozyma saopauloensis]|uniref:Uncharacterized protein n=1 Tax=Australozyma saopauloensis TaxID=291208 RepID=A0AAX4H898_9ASCO|nr:hypothetical protein PUMCH_001715 [[Candida] saopauloensis]